MRNFSPPTPTTLLLLPLLLLQLLPPTQAATCTSNKIDIVLCLDGSYSMGSGYDDVQDFAIKVVNKFTISPTETRIAVYRYETDVDVSGAPTTNGFSGTQQTIIDAINKPLPGGITYTDKCIVKADELFTASARPGVGKLLLVLTDGTPTDQGAAETAATAAIANGITIVGVGANVGGARANVLALTSNKCVSPTGCSSGLQGPPACVTPCDDHYIDASTFAALDSLVDNVVDLTCVEPGCQYTWGAWSECSSADPPMRHQDPVILPGQPSFPPGSPEACPTRKTEECTTIECAAKADFLILLDASGSMSACDWKGQAWFAKEFVSRLPSTGNTFDHARVSIVQFASGVEYDQPLTTSRKDVLDVLDCDRCAPEGTGVCNYQMKSGGTSTMIAMLGGMGVLANAPPRADGAIARKVIILATDGTPNGQEGLPSAMQSWCQSNGHPVSSRQDMVVCTSKYAQSTSAPTVPANTCGVYSYGCVAYDALNPLDATVVTVGVNVNGYSGAALETHFKEVASDPSLFLKIDDINGPNLDGMITDLLSKACPPVDCICKQNTPWGPCDPLTQTQTNNCIPEVLPDKGGAPCVSPTRPCGDCVWHWGPYGACNQETGKKTRQVVVDKQPTPGGNGIACPTDPQDDACVVDCKYKWGEYVGDCLKAGDTKTREPVCLTATTGNPCPPAQPLNGGQACPLPETKDCEIQDCEYTWDAWSHCINDPVIGKQNRAITKTKDPIGVGAMACPPPEERPCKVDCESSYPDWSSSPCDPLTGKQKRYPAITQQPINGYDGQGDPCPGPEERSCDVDCLGKYSEWSICASPSGSYPPFTKSRSFIPTQQPLNNGQACPPPEEVPCLPEVCWTAESTAPSFGPRKEGMKPFQTLPPNHPAFTRTDCGGPLTDSDWIPTLAQGVAPSLAHCYGSQLFYALDTATGRTQNHLVTGRNNAAVGVSQFFLMQDSESRLYFGMMNGGPGKSKNVNGASADIKFTFTGIDSQNNDVDWGIKNDESNVATNTDCAPVSGNDCYTWDAITKEGKAEWMWKDGETSGGMIGPLPSYGFCATLKVKDVKGIDTYELAERDDTDDTTYAKTTVLDANAFARDDFKVCTYQCALGPPCIIDSATKKCKAGGTTGTTGTSTGTTTGTTTGTSDGSDTTDGTGTSTGTATSDGTGTGTSDGSSSGSGSGGDGDSGTPASCSTGKVNAAGDGCEAICSAGKVNAAGDGCEAACSSGTVNAAGDGCDAICSTGTVNVAGDGCEDPDATLEDGGTLVAPGDFTPAGEFTPAKDKDGNPVNQDGDSDGDKEGNVGGIIGGILGGLACCLLLVAVLLFVRRRQQQKGGRSALADEENLPEGWSSFIDEASGYPCYVNDATGETQWDPPPGTGTGGGGIEMANPMQQKKKKGGHHARNSTQLPDGWDKLHDDDGNKYYADNNTGETSWDAPPGSVGGSAEATGEANTAEEGSSHTRNLTELPSGWGKDTSGEDNYYYNEETGETSWTAPEGSTKDGSLHPDLHF